MASVMNAAATAAAVVGAVGVAADSAKLSHRRNAFFGGDSKRTESVVKLRAKRAAGAFRVVAESLGATNSTVEGGKPAAVSNAEVPSRPGNAVYVSDFALAD